MTRKARVSTEEQRSSKRERPRVVCCYVVFWCMFHPEPKSFIDPSVTVFSHLFLMLGGRKTLTGLLVTFMARSCIAGSSPLERFCGMPKKKNAEKSEHARVYDPTVKA